MSGLAHQPPTDPDAFVAWENRQRARYELIDGVVHMMTGGTLGHDRVSMNIARALGNALAGGPCAVHGSNLKVRSPAGAVMYPDALVRCGPADEDATEIDDPVLVVEVHSPRTRRYDMTGKRWAYYAIPSLRYILLVDPGDCMIELVSRDAEGRWLSALVQQPGARLELPALGIDMAVADVYAGTAVASRAGSG
jgi:Uma2 family endonuclease